MAKEEQSREQDMLVVANAIAQAEKKRKQLKDRDQETLAQYKHSLREQLDSKERFHEIQKNFLTPLEFKLNKEKLQTMGISPANKNVIVKLKD